MAILPEIFTLSPDPNATLQHKIQQAVAGAILSGRCVAGEKMPSSRKLAAHLGVARITVTLAYTDLVSNEYLIARGRSGYYVSLTAPKRPTFEPHRPTRESKVDWVAKFSRKIPQYAQISRPPNWREYQYPFIYGQSDANLFDHNNWRACAMRAVGKREFDSLATDHYQRDDAMLIDFILRHFLPRRGITASPDEILITMGTQNGLWLVSELLLRRGGKAVVENPCYPGFRQILSNLPCETMAIDLDKDGLDPDKIPHDADVVFITPGLQCPTNVQMPAERRQALLDRALRDDFVVVEDDYEIDMTPFRNPMPALKSQDHAGTVIYTGSFSKSIFPGLRIGYLVAPKEVINEARALRGLVYRHPPSHVQRTIAYFLSLGHFDTQLARLSRHLRKRRTVMEDALVAHGMLPTGRVMTNGSSFWIKAPAQIDTTALALDLRNQSVLIEPGRVFFAPERPDNSWFRMAYSSIPTNNIEPGIALIAQAIANRAGFTSGP
jgi:GntR family transcriptional regulator/MocR family aminotransferase